MRNRFIASLLLVLFLSILGIAQTSQAGEERILKHYLEQILLTDPAFSGFDVKQGEAIYFNIHTHSKGETRACADCHSGDPRQPSQHITTGKPIDPLAPSVNSERFTELKKTEKWFRRNCKWTIERECTSEEKGHFIVYLQSL
ncbi:MAG: DUF1924 domain-containing protein [SAR324 cluster bacterium]|jgi:hypothetical protein|nr:hypothetical protein [Magnetovibrio sp.]MDP6638580.1 DUF1924 domain-containing protein [SAR324 cluster bacterium]MDP6764725.1 DUF1924 domain-containing protein [SAR324 cluster bacterium]|tara:strand:- start:240 stop:668 length:429 start_codon:yes stop_codon:yes gene_type:complete